MSSNDLISADLDIRQLQQALTPRLTKYIPLDPTPKQTAFLLMNSLKEILYGGAAGGGKSIAQLMGALQFVDIPGYNAILFRKTFADLSKPGALMDISKDWLMPFVERKEVKWSDKEKRFTFPSSATLTFGYLETVNDMYNYQGAEYQYIGMDECTQINPVCYRYLFSRLRRAKSVKVPLRFRATCNPGGEFGEYYYQRFFIEGTEKGRIFIPAGIKDNPYLDEEEYNASLDELDPITREQLKNGNWQIREGGGLFDRKWFTVVDYSNIPEKAKRVRFWDLASTDPSKRKSKDKRDPDYTVGLKLAFYQGLYWIEDIVRVQKTPKEVQEIVQMTAEFDGHSCDIDMEQEPGSSGDITIDHYARNVLAGYVFKGVRSTGSKVERARPASTAAQQGRIMISNKCRNISEFLDEAELFPYGIKDDTVDGLSGSFNHFRSPSVFAAPSGVNKGQSYWKNI